MRIYEVGQQWVYLLNTQLREYFYLCSEASDMFLQTSD